jgi:hypothetical protein
MNRQQSRPSSTPQCEVIFATLQQKKEKKKREAHTKNFCEKKKVPKAPEFEEKNFWNCHI